MEIYRKHKQSILAFCILLAVGLYAYSNSFHSEFQFDDESSITHNPTVRLGTFEKLWHYSPTRFVPHLTFALNYKFNGEDVFGYHVVNFLIHLLAAFAVYFFSMLLFRTPRISDSSRKIPEHFIALFAALIFLCHPVQTQAVTYIVQRIASLAALFYIFAVVFYLHSRLTGNKIVYLFSLGSCGLALMSKENAFTLPFAILLLEWIGWGFSKKDILKQTARIAPFFMIAMTFPDFYLLRILSPVKGPWVADAQKYWEELRISRADYLLTQFRVICTYLRLLVFPVNQIVDYDYPVYHRFFDLPVLAGFAFLSAVFVSGFFLLKKQRLLAFGIFWFFLTISIESSIIPINDVIFEHRMYLPMAGAAVFLSYGIYKVFSNPKEFLIAVSVLVLVLSAMTFSRNSAWKTRISLWTDNIKKTPKKARAYFNLGQAYGDDCPKEGVSSYHKAIELDPNYALSYLNLAVCYSKKGDSAAEEAYYKKAIEKDVNFILAYFDLGNFYVEQGKKDKAIAMFEQALKIGPDYVPALNNLALIYFNEGDNAKAEEYWKDAIRRDPSYINNQMNLGILYSQQEKWDLAAKQFEATLRYAPTFADAAYNLGVAYFKLNRREDAERQLLILKQFKNPQFALKLEKVLQGKISEKKKRTPKDFVKCDSWDDECFEQYDEALRDAQKDIAQNEEIREIVELNKFVRSIKQ